MRYCPIPTGALRHKLLYTPLASCFLPNLDFLLLHISHLDTIIFETFGFILCIFLTL